MVVLIERHNMLQDPNPTDYPELEKFCDWLYENYGKLPQDFESLKKAQVEYSALCAIRDAAKGLMPFMGKALADGTFKNCVAPLAVNQAVAAFDAAWKALKQIQAS